MSDDFPTLREYMRSRREPWVITQPDTNPPGVPTPDLLADLVKQVRLSNLIQWAALTNNQKRFAAEIEEGLKS